MGHCTPGLVRPVPLHDLHLPSPLQAVQRALPASKILRCDGFAFGYFRFSFACVVMAGTIIFAWVLLDAVLLSPADVPCLRDAVFFWNAVCFWDAVSLQVQSLVKGRGRSICSVIPTIRARTRLFYHFLRRDPLGSSPLRRALLHRPVRAG